MSHSPHPHPQPSDYQQPNQQPPAPGYQPQQPASTGAAAWWLGLLALFGVPIFSNLLGILVVGIFFALSGNWPPAARENARQALNWQLSLLFYTFVLVGAHIIVLVVFGDATSYLPVGIPITLLGVLWLYHLIGTIVCAIRAQREPATLPGTLPFVWRARGPRFSHARTL